MQRQTGFTLVELMVVIAILGILAITAMPFYQTWTQRAYGVTGDELMRNSSWMRQIMYYLDKKHLSSQTEAEMIFIPTRGQILPPATAFKRMENALKYSPSRQQICLHSWNDQ